MSRTLEFIFDFASPNAYLAWRALPPVLERTGAALAVAPCLLGGLFKLTGNQAPMTAFAGVKGKLAYEALELQRFIARHGLDRWRMNPHFPLNTLTPMRGLVAAQADGVEQPYLEAVLAATWEDGEKVDNPAVLSAALDRAGLDGASLLARTQDPAVKVRLLESTQACADRGAFGVPTFFVGEAMFFGKERLGQVEAALAE